MRVNRISSQKSAKNVSWLALAGTRAQIHQTLCKRDNLGDVTVKAASQSTAAGLLGLVCVSFLQPHPQRFVVILFLVKGTGLGIVVSSFVGTHPLACFGSLIPLSALSLYGVYASNRVVVSNTLSGQRLDLLLQHWFSDCNTMEDFKMTGNRTYHQVIISHPPFIRQHLTASTTHHRNPWNVCVGISRFFAKNQIQLFTSSFYRYFRRLSRLDGSVFTISADPTRTLLPSCDPVLWSGRTIDIGVDRRFGVYSGRIEIRVSCLLDKSSVASLNRWSDDGRCFGCHHKPRNGVCLFRSILHSSQAKWVVDGVFEDFTTSSSISLVQHSSG